MKICAYILCFTSYTNEYFHVSSVHTEKNPPLKFSFMKSTIFFSYYVSCTLRFSLRHQYIQLEHGFKLLEAMLKKPKQLRLIERQSLLWELLIQYNGCSVLFCYSENLYLLISRSDLLFICLFRIVFNSDDMDSSIPLYIKKCVVANLLSQTDTFKIAHIIK